MTRKTSASKWIFLIVFIIISVAGIYLYKTWSYKLNKKSYVFVYIYPSMDVKNLADTLFEKNVIKNRIIFEFLSEEMGLKKLKAGKYRITNKMNLPAIIRLFKNGKDEKVSINIHGRIFYYDDLINTIDNKLLIKKNEITQALNNHPTIKNNEWMNVLLIKSYQVSWAIQAKDILDSIENFYHHIWNTDRKKLLKRTGLSEKECMILASIVQHESYIYSEQRKIAGVYLNRLKKQMPLQADPTLKYINHKMDAARLYNKDKQNDSPYNTYKYKGLPPTTIGAVSIQALDAVLNYETHNYLYFCAKPELNGYSNYSTTFLQHLKNAQQYQKQLDKLNIK